MNNNLIAIVDLGKTHAKLLLAAVGSGEVVWSRERRNGTGPAGPCAQLDVTGLERWLLDSLADAPDRQCIDAIVPVAHGATAVWLDAAGAVLCAPDYEDPVFESRAERYAAARDPYADTRSPLLPLGLNLGRQLHHLQHAEPRLRAHCAHLLLYPQYWAWRLSGLMASEVTSLGCHTDLWLPEAARYSALARREGWDAWLPPLRNAGERLGPVRAELCARTGLRADCQVLCGIHDSNASYLSHLASWSRPEPIAVIASGTWVVLFAQGAPLSTLREEADMLANVDAHGRPVATARFMGGREYEVIAGPQGATATLDARSLRQVLDRDAFALPAFASGGPCDGIRGDVRNAEGVAAPALATLYTALMCDWRLDDLHSRQPVVVDGPLAANALFAPLLAALRPTTAIHVADRRSGIARGALRLAQPGRTFDMPQGPVAALELPGVTAYRDAWRQRVTAHCARNAHALS